MTVIKDSNFLRDDVDSFEFVSAGFASQNDNKFKIRVEPSISTMKSPVERRKVFIHHEGISGVHVSQQEIEELILVLQVVVQQLRTYDQDKE